MRINSIYIYNIVVNYTEEEKWIDKHANWICFVIKISPKTQCVRLEFWSHVTVCGNQNKSIARIYATRKFIRYSATWLYEKKSRHKNSCVTFEGKSEQRLTERKRRKQMEYNLWLLWYFRCVFNTPISNEMFHLYLIAIGNRWIFGVSLDSHSFLSQWLQFNLFISILASIRCLSESSTSRLAVNYKYITKNIIRFFMHTYFMEWKKSELIKAVI